MKTFKLLLILALFLSLACQSVQYPGPLTYIAVDQPVGKIDTSQSQKAIFKKSRVGFLYRSPVGVADYLKEAESRGAGQIQRNGDVVMRVPFCILFFCIGSDSITVRGK
ncbi:hypothetical protein EHQ53_13700 [Leptospira langatensis]|uniref:TRL-like family protein n=1 Tax=Leptospira langatensis TaxID=2484983 RepID=A0A5F1ZQZ2_9LEPT|nr:hypothetical protein [Leptospira langatensis]TGK02580.1 hypothetical protein EHO57_04415 [Leptospira langatensis]TGL40220.1 hypothetical protein EHQ53_13700 [Leptospira langatensis]